MEREGLLLEGDWMNQFDFYITATAPGFLLVQGASLDACHHPAAMMHHRVYLSSLGIKYKHLFLREKLSVPFFV